MFTTILQTVGGYFDRRWMLAAFLPSVVLFGACLFLYGATHDFRRAIDIWNKFSPILQGALIVAGVIWTAFVAVLFSLTKGGMLRLFEGYTEQTPLLSAFHQWRRRYYQRLFRYLAHEQTRLEAEIAHLRLGPLKDRPDAKDKEKVYKEELGRILEEKILRFPPDESQVMPTRLGNILRAAEAYPRVHYNMNAVVLWSRLASVLPDPAAAGLEDARMFLDFMLVLCVSSFLFAATSAVYLAAAHAASILTWFVLISLGVSWLCYHGMLNAAIVYGEAVKTAFDLHRWALLEAVHLAAPANNAEERVLWDDYGGFVYGGFPLKAAYEAKKPE
ncbi:hypothetical protein CCAX7_57020 [Capsulimonas corticalis]|uniref:Uncharacterized protein n=1 Tax=Capsulimonas corticalis TaxID=2219043 RepID=A0A402D0I3_9BACT|nr:hypothetical protein [Capsulimonas corticalis]BDI33651.1 hypothetical protein CCAX7_57020 [Capsulimonas corticalis]